MSDNFEARIEKYFEGTSLGLAAVADVLEKMDGRFEKADQEEEDEAIQKQADSDRTALIKDVVSAIMKANGQADNDLDLSVASKKASGTTSTANDKSGDDSSEGKSDDNPTSTAGAPIQAEDDEELEDENPFASDDEEEDASGDDEDPVAKMIKQLEKQIASLSLALGKGDEATEDVPDEEYPMQEDAEEKSYDQSIAKSVGGMKDIMSKMGIRESGSSQIKRVSLSPEVSPSDAFISKSASGEQQVDFTKLSYKELRRLEDGIRSGAITEVEL